MDARVKNGIAREKMADAVPYTRLNHRTARHTTSYLAAGPIDGPLIIFLHGWPELAVSWRHQLGCFATLGFRVIAPDMRGYGYSSVPVRRQDYALELVVQDMIELIDHLGRDAAVWVGHDFGAPVVWGIASHCPERCTGVANLCVPHFPEGFTADNLVKYVDRSIYPADIYPAGQWDYQFDYIEHFGEAARALDADPGRTVRAIFRRGQPEMKGKPFYTAHVRKDGGRFGGAGIAPDLPRDPAIITEKDLQEYVTCLTRTGFAAANSLYVNVELNHEYALRARNGGTLGMPALFIHAAYDWVCATCDTRLADPMRASCSNLEEVVIASGHWMQQERPQEVNGAIAGWVARQLPASWPKPRAVGMDRSGQ